MKKTCLLGGNFALDTIVTRDYPDGFVVGKSNKFTETIVTETVGNTCGNVACMLAYLGVQTFPIAHLDLSEQGLKIKEDLQQYGADVRFVENSDKGGTTLLRCTHKRDKTTGEHTVSFRATSPGSRFPKRRFLRARDEAPSFMENLNFTPDIFFFDAAEAGLRYLAGELRKRGTLVYFEPESDADKNKFLKAVEVSDIVKFSHEKVRDISFMTQYTDKLFIRTLSADGLEFNLRGQGWVKVNSVPNDNVVDWEGAGDWTTSQFIACLCERDILSVAQMSVDSVRKCLEVACEVASQSVSFLGSKGLIDRLDDIFSYFDEPINFEIVDGVAIIPKDIMHIERGAFNECPSLEKVIVHEDVKLIDEEAFFDCENLHTVILEGQTLLYQDSFTRCPRLTRISVPYGMAEYYKELLDEHWHYYIEEE